MTYSVTLTPIRISYKLMHLEWSVSDPAAPVAKGAVQTLHDEHPEVVKQNLRQIGLGEDAIERILYTGATVELTQAQMADLGILLDRAEISDES